MEAGIRRMERNWLLIRQGLSRVLPWAVGLCLIILAWWWVWPPLVNRFLTVSIEAPGRLEREWYGEALVLPQGEMVVAPIAGRVTFLSRHGQWVEPGSVLAEIIDPKGNPEVVYSPIGGIVDLEVRISQKVGMMGARQRKSQWQDGDPVAAGMELARVIRPQRIFLRVQLPFRLPSFARIEGLVAEMRGQTNEEAKINWYAARLDSVEDGVVDLDVVGFPTEWLERETLSVVLRLKGPMGQRVPESAVFTYQGELGVLLVTQLGYGFRKVEILDKTEGEAIVSGLAVGDRVVTRPRLVMKK